MDLPRLIRRFRTKGGDSSARPDFLFVVTYGRSGSTLVQGLLNSLPRTLVRGENNLYILPMFQAWTLARDFKRKHGKDARRGAHSAFYGLDEVKPRDFVESTRALTVKQLFGNAGRSEVDRLGFKEVLWHRIDPQETAAFFEFFELVFPDARYVLNRRDREQVATSGFWQRRGSDAAMAAVERVEEIQDYLRESRPNRTHCTRYEDLTSEDNSVVEEQLQGLAQFAIGWCDEQILSGLRATMAKGHGPRPFGRSRTGDAPASEES